MRDLEQIRVPRASRRRFLAQSSVAVRAAAIPAALQARAEAAGGVSPAARQVIVVYLQGGLSHLDSFDLKPNAPAEYRGEFRPIATTVPGYGICEHLPRLARLADRFNVIRSAWHGTPSHEAAIHWTLTGYDYPGANTTTKNRNVKPAMGSVVSKVRGPNRPGLPAYVCVPDRGQLGDRVRYASAVHLGMAHDPFESGMPPSSATAPFPAPPNLSLSSEVDLSRIGDRLELLRSLDQLPQSLDTSGLMAGMDTFSRQAMELLAHDVTRKAFDLSAEPETVRLRYGDNQFAQRLVLARRLAEAGVPFTLVNFSNNQEWDTHTNNFASLKTTRLPELDQAVATLLEELDERGLLETTLVAVFGEFGRTPRINASAGRDHWSDVFSVLLAGGGLTAGQVLGTSTANAERPHDRPIHFNDVLATMYQQMGIDYGRHFDDQFGRPVPILYEGRPIAELV